MNLKRTRMISFHRPWRRLRPVRAVKPTGGVQQTAAVKTAAHYHKRGSTGGNLIEALRIHGILVFLAMFLLCGVVMGALFARSAGPDILKRLDFLFYSDFQSRAVQAPASIFIASLGSTFLFLLACFLCGLSMWGMFLVPVVPLFRGFGLGLTSGYLYAAYGLQGVLFNAAVILPGAFLCVISILLAAREGIYFSKKIAGCGISKDPVYLRLKTYLARFGSIMILAFVSAIVDLAMTFCFAGLFSF